MNVVLATVVYMDSRRKLNCGVFICTELILFATISAVDESTNFTQCHDSTLYGWNLL